MSEETPPQPSKQPELPPDILRMVEMMGGTAVPVDAGTFIGVMGEMTFSKVMEAMVKYACITRHYLTHKETPKDGDEKDQSEMCGHTLAMLALLEALSEHFAKRLGVLGFPDDSNTHKASLVLGIAAISAGSVGDLGGTLLKEISNDKLLSQSIKDRVTEIQKESHERAQQLNKQKEDEAKNPKAPDGKRFIQFDRAKLASLKASYADALATDKLAFTFDGAEWDIGYAKYAIEYLETQMAQKGM